MKLMAPTTKMKFGTVEETIAMNLVLNMLFSSKSMYKNESA
jgi:hypothetical protein